jgi:molybdopterin converting factor small subunit
MEVEVLLFGAAATRENSDRVTVVVATNPTVRDVLAALHEQHPDLRFALPAAETGRLAVNQSFAKAEHPIRAGDEVALITLVGGG